MKNAICKLTAEDIRKELMFAEAADDPTPEGRAWLRMLRIASTKTQRSA